MCDDLLAADFWRLRLFFLNGVLASHG
jgi:hypothetical protein